MICVFHVQFYYSLSLQKGNQKWTYRRTLVIDLFLQSCHPSSQSLPPSTLAWLGRQAAFVPWICLFSLRCLNWAKFHKIPIDLFCKRAMLWCSHAEALGLHFPTSIPQIPTYSQHIYIYITYSMRHHETLALLLFKSTFIGFESAVVVENFFLHRSHGCQPVPAKGVLPAMNTALSMSVAFHVISCFDKSYLRYEPINPSPPSLLCLGQWRACCLLLPLTFFATEKIYFFLRMHAISRCVMSVTIMKEIEYVLFIIYIMFTIFDRVHMMKMTHQRKDRRSMPKSKRRPCQVDSPPSSLGRSQITLADAKCCCFWSCYWPWAPCAVQVPRRNRPPKQLLTSVLEAEVCQVEVGGSDEKKTLIAKGGGIAPLEYPWNTQVHLPMKSSCWDEYCKELDRHRWQLYWQFCEIAMKRKRSGWRCWTTERCWKATWTRKQ